MRSMTKVDENAYVPEIDEAARQRLSEALDKEGVVAAMLIGSQARGEAELVERDRAQRVRFETRAILEFLDLKPLYEQFGQLD